MIETFFHQQLQFTRSFKKRLNEELAVAGLFHSQWLVLYCIQKQKSITLVEISNYLDVEKPTVSRTVKRLEEQGLVEAIPSDDKRERPMRLSTKGHESFEMGQEIISRFEADLMKEVSDADLITILKTMQIFKEKMKEGKSLDE